MSDVSGPGPITSASAEADVASPALAADSHSSGGIAPVAGFGPELATLAVLVFAVAAGQSLFFRAPLIATLGPIAGLIAGLGCRRWWSAAIVASIGVTLGALVAPVVGSLSWDARSVWLPLAIEAGLVAAILGALVASVLRRRERLFGVVAALALIAIVATMWIATISNAQVASGTAPSAVQRLASTPQIRRQISDEDLYLIWIAQLRHGAPYYPMVVRTFARLQTALGNQSLVRIRSPLSYRPPTLYLLLSSLPPNGISFVIAMLVVCTGGVLAAYILAREFARHTTSLLSAIIVASAFVALGTSQLLDAEAWAGVFVLATVTVFAVARTRPRHSRALQVFAVLLGLVATAFREIAVPVLVLGLAATLIDPEERSKRTWVLWASGLAIAGLGLTAHWIAAAHAFASATGRPVASSWFDPNGAGLVGALFFESASEALTLPAAALLLVLGMLGSTTAPRDSATRVMLAGIAVGGPLALMVVHPPGWGAIATAPGYWGDIIWPTLLACVPLAFVWVGRRLARA